MECSPFGQYAAEPALGQDGPMHSTTSSALNRPAHSGFGFRLAARLLQPLSLLWRPRLDPERVTLIARIVASEPALRQWLLVIAGEEPRVRRALLARGVQ